LALCTARRAVAWLPVSRRCVGLHGRCRPFRLRSGAGRCGCEPVAAAISGEASGPGPPCVCGARHPDRVRLRLQIVGRTGPLSARSAPGWIATAVGLAPRVLPLIPQVAFVFLQAGDRRSRRLLRSDLVAAPPWPPVAGGSVRSAHSVTACPPCAFRLRHRDLSTACFVRPIPSGTGPPHWLAVATPVGTPPTAFAHTTRNHGWRGVTRLAFGFVRPHRLFDRVAWCTRSPPRPCSSQSGEVRPSPQGRVTSASQGGGRMITPCKGSGTPVPPDHSARLSPGVIPGLGPDPPERTFPDFYILRLLFV
jgi:hypothetical protein